MKKVSKEYGEKTVLFVLCCPIHEEFQRLLHFSCLFHHHFPLTRKGKFCAPIDAS